MQSSIQYGKLAQHTELRDRTRAFALRIVKVCDSLPARRSSDVIAKQLLKAGTSVAANYRAAGRARSRAEFIAKLCIVVEEADETIFWLQLRSEAELLPPDRLTSLQQETNELVAIF